jgi:hypothetical protein
MNTRIAAADKRSVRLLVIRQRCRTWIAVHVCTSIQILTEWSGRRDLNSRSRAPKARGLNQTFLRPEMGYSLILPRAKLWRTGLDSNQRLAVLQTAAFGRLATDP